MSQHYVHLYETFNKNILEDLSFNGAEKLLEQQREKEKEEYNLANFAFSKVDQTLLVKAPYDKDLIDSFKKLEGKWNPENKLWGFSLVKEKEVRALIKEKYGFEEKQSLEDKITMILDLLEKQNKN